MHEQPLPAAQPAHACHVVQDHAGHRRAEEGGHRDRHHEVADHLRPVLPREPVGEVQDDAGEEPRFRDPQHHAQRVERPLAPHQRHRRRHQPPGDHDPRDPAPGAEPLQQQVARHLEDEIRQEEQPGAEPEHRRRQVQVLAQIMSGEPKVHPVDKRDEVAHHQKRHEPQADTPNSRALERYVVDHGRFPYLHDATAVAACDPGKWGASPARSCSAVGAGRPHGLAAVADPWMPAAGGPPSTASNPDAANRPLAARLSALKPGDSAIQPGARHPAESFPPSGRSRSGSHSGCHARTLPPAASLLQG